MNLLRTAALRVPAIRHLYDSRNMLQVERDALLSERNALRLEVVKARYRRAQGRLILTDYPYRPRKRPIEDAAGGGRLTARLRREEDCYTATLSGIARHIGALLCVPREENDPSRPFWANQWFPPFDAASLYGLIAERAPRRYIEVGSGFSTRFARQAISDLDLQTRIISIDPHPRTSIDALCDEVVRCPMEEVPRDFWEGIDAQDLLFIDNSHRSFPNSDVTVFFTEVLPALRPGIVWGMHDIFLPWDYPDEWRQRFYNEQYLLLAYLLGGADGDEIVLPVTWVASQPKLHSILASLWVREDLFSGDVGTHGQSFWMRRASK